MSLDARTAPADSEGSSGRMWISGEASRADVQSWRARSSAVLTGAGTVRADDPRLDVRLAYGPWVRQPLRVRARPGAVMLAERADFPGRRRAGVRRRGRAAAALAPHFTRGACTGGGARVGPQGRHRALDAREVNELWVECGPRLAAAFLEARLVDELIVYVAPILLGADAAPLTARCAVWTQRAPLPTFEFKSLQRMGADLRLVLSPASTRGS